MLFTITPLEAYHVSLTIYAIGNHITASPSINFDNYSFILGDMPVTPAHNCDHSSFYASYCIFCRNLHFT
jgi:hypothetical protein